MARAVICICFSAVCSSFKLKALFGAKTAVYMSCHRDGGTSQGDTRHSVSLARRRGGFNFDD